MFELLRLEGQFTFFNNQASSKERTFSWHQAQIQHIHQCAEHRSNMSGDWKGKSTSNNVTKTGEEEERTILMS